MSLDSKWLSAWKLTSSENFEELLQVYGVSMITRKTAAQLSPVVTISEEGEGKYLYKSETTFKSTQFSFKLGEEFEEKTADDAKVMSIITKESDTKLIQVQKATDKRVETHITRELEGDKFKMVIVAGGVTCTRIYTKQ